MPLRLWLAALHPLILAVFLFHHNLLSFDISGS